MISYDKFYKQLIKDMDFIANTYKNTAIAAILDLNTPILPSKMPDNIYYAALAVKYGTQSAYEFMVAEQIRLERSVNRTFSVH